MKNQQVRVGLALEEFRTITYKKYIYFMCFVPKERKPDFITKTYTCEFTWTVTLKFRISNVKCKSCGVTVGPI